MDWKPGAIFFLAITVLALPPCFGNNSSSVEQAVEEKASTDEITSTTEEEEISSNLDIGSEEQNTTQTVYPKIGMNDPTTEKISVEIKSSEDPTGEIFTVERAQNNNDLENTKIKNSKDQRSHEPRPSSFLTLLIGQQDSLSISDISHQQRLPDIIARENLSAFSIDYIYNDSLIFFAAEGQIYRAQLDNDLQLRNKTSIINEKTDGQLSLAVDWINRKLYWMAVKYQSLMMSNLDGSNLTRLFENLKNFSYPNNIAVDPYAGLIFVVANFTIYKSDLNHISLKRVQIEGNSPGDEKGGVVCIALDRKNRKIYLSGKSHDEKLYLSTTEYDGTNILDFDIKDDTYIFSMEVLKDTLYFAQFMDSGYVDRESCPDEVMSVSTKNLPEFKPEQKFISGNCTNEVFSIKVYDSCVQNPSQCG